MRRVFAVLAIVLVIVAGWIYFVLPSGRVIKTGKIMATTRTGLHRLLVENNNTMNWWPHEKTVIGGDSVLQLNNKTFQFRDNNISLISALIKTNGYSLQTALYLVPLTDTTVQVEWIGELINFSNPWQRVRAYFTKRAVQRDMDTILTQLYRFTAQTKNMYGFDVQLRYITDSTFIALADTMAAHPAVDQLYAMIDQLRVYAQKQQARIIGDPLLNINFEEGSYIVKVALPIDKALEPYKMIVPQRMPPGVKILVTEVKGGFDATAVYYKRLIQYAYDRHLQIPGKPFFSLVTDRRRNPDTLTWVTRIFCPIR